MSLEITLHPSGRCTIVLPLAAIDTYTDGETAAADRQTFTDLVTEMIGKVMPLVIKDTAETSVTGNDDSSSKNSSSGSDGGFTDDSAGIASEVEVHAASTAANAKADATEPQDDGKKAETDVDTVSPSTAEGITFAYDVLNDLKSKNVEQAWVIFGLSVNRTGLENLWVKLPENRRYEPLKAMIVEFVENCDTPNEEWRDETTINDETTAASVGLVGGVNTERVNWID